MLGSHSRHLSVDRPGRRRPVGVLALLAVAILLLGLLGGVVIGRLTAARAAASHPTHATAQAPAGPTTTTDGVPTGYAHDRSGAIAAATSYLVWANGPAILDPTKYVQQQQVLATSGGLNTLSSQAQKATLNNSAFIEAKQQGKAVVMRILPLAYQVQVYSSDKATVGIWFEYLTAADGVQAPASVWGTDPIQLAWQAGDWHVDSWGSGTEGPVPTVTQGPEQTTQLPSQLSSWTRYRDGQP